MSTGTMETLQPGEGDENVRQLQTMYDVPSPELDVRDVEVYLTDQTSAPTEIILDAAEKDDPTDIIAGSRAIFSNVLPGVGHTALRNSVWQSTSFRAAGVEGVAFERRSAARRGSLSPVIGRYATGRSHGMPPV